ncbi:hypothetical protein [Pseudoalteromonas sp. Of7M-16]|uniref:hypothetical protein n=1 Tax=Pseudoalteromonas sp. Of7M-16 TaxID=2917756 RepID=UPI001EF5C148|nr:hypothetical protein [Pseudoalteromonas sp. Of7M-16]MCG7550945.1 hypothetical protein [Pseudoalteromonas sp. Of7M-16]
MSRRLLRQAYDQLKSEDFELAFEFKLEIQIPPENLYTGPVPNLNLFAKDAEEGGYSIDYESKRIGTANINSPTSKSAGSVKFTARDNKNQDLENFLMAMKDTVINHDGTINMPFEYLFHVILYKPNASGEYVEAHKWYCSAEEMGAKQLGYEKGNEFTYFDVAFKKYRS